MHITNFNEIVEKLRTIRVDKEIIEHENSYAVINDFLCSLDQNMLTPYITNYVANNNFPLHVSYLITCNTHQYVQIWVNFVMISN